jgi:hypothetical protein
MQGKAEITGNGEVEKKPYKVDLVKEETESARFS